MRKIAKYILPLIFLASSCSELKQVQTPEITYAPKHSQEFWEERAGFEFKKRNFIYQISADSISSGKEILYIKERKPGIDYFIKVVERNHYGNVDEIYIEGTKNLFFFEGKNLGGRLGYKFVVEENQEPSPELAKKLFLNYDETFRKFKEKYSIEDKLEELNY